jgi:16S rRNA (guanine527-N7)-methyltransferase
MTDHVSRETPPVPAAARGVFSDALPSAVAYARLLATEGVVRGLIGPREAPRLWERHLLNCALLGEAMDRGVDVCDIGSGAGLPGLVLALSRPDLTVTLVEPLLRRTTFLEEAVAELRLSNVEVLRGRAQDLHGERDFAVVTSRAVAPLGRLLDWSMPLVRLGGALLAMKGSSAAEEVAAAERELRRHGAGAVTIATYGEGVVDPPTTVVRVAAGRLSRRGLAGARPGAAGKGPNGPSRRKGRKS